jgi:fatty acid desaturase
MQSGANIVLKDKIKSLESLHGDNFNGILQVIEDWAVITIAILVSESLHRYELTALCLEIATKLGEFDPSFLPLKVLTVLFYATSVLIIGCRMRALAELLHQASHYTLCANRSLNNLLGTAFTGWPIFYSFSVYRASHTTHHNSLGLADVDPDYVAIKSTGLYDNGRSARGLITYLLTTILSPVSILSYLKYLLINRMYSDCESPNERKLRFSFYSLLFISLYFNPYALYLFVWYWLVPLCTTAAWVGAFIELLEHYPLMEDLPDHNHTLRTRNRICSPFVNFFIGIHHEGYHLVHHLYPRIPAWRLPQTHVFLMEDDSLYADLHNRVKPGFVNMITETLKLCDMDRSKMTGYLLQTCTPVRGDAT